MIDGAATARDAVLVAIALLGGYLLGSIPTARLVGAGTGPGWSFLALVIDLAKGILPVAIGIVTWSWWIGWAAGVGAVLGASWPALGRGTAARSGQGVATFGGGAFTLAPAAGVLSGMLAVLTLGVGRVAGRDARVAAATVGFASFPALFLVVHQDLVRLGALLVLYAVAVVHGVTTRDH